MKNRILLVFLAMVLVVSLAAFGACAKPAEEEKAPPVEEKASPVEEKAPAKEEKAAPPKEEKEAPPVEEAWEWMDKLTILSYSTSSIDYAVGVAWSTVLASETGIKVRLVAEDSDYLRSLWCSQGRFDMGLVAGTGSFEATEHWATRDLGPYDFRTILPVFLSEQGYPVRADSGIDTPYDLKGKRICLLTSAGAFGKMVMAALLAWGNLTEDDVIWVPVSSNDVLSRFIIDGKADVAVGDVSSPRWYEAAAAPHGLSTVNLNPVEDPEGALRFLAILPTFQFAEHKGGFPNARGRWGLVTFLTYGCSAEHMSVDFAYHMVKWIDENYDLFKDKHPYLAGMTPVSLVSIAETASRPLHDGVIKYLKEIGLWTETLQARHQKKIDLVQRYIDAYAKAIDLADEKGIKVNPANEKWATLWENYKKELGIPPETSLSVLPAQPGQ